MISTEIKGKGGSTLRLSSRGGELVLEVEDSTGRRVEFPRSPEEARNLATYIGIIASDIERP